jgi:drug/metabolite transporter (DMT)-like permease
MQHILFLTVSLLWGVNFLLMKIAVTAYTPIGVAAIRVFSGALFLTLIVVYRERQWPFRRIHIPGLAVIVLMGYAWPFIVQPYLIQFCGSGMIGLMPSLVPLITISISIPMLGVRPTPRQFTGVLAGLGFISLLFIDGLHRDIDLLHLAAAITVPLSYAVSNTYVKRTFSKVSPVMLTFVCLAATTIILTPHAIVEPLQANYDNASVILPTISAVALGVFGTGIALLCFTIMLQKRGPLFAGMVTYVIPVIALLIGALDGEHVSALQIIALSGILAMVAIVQWPSQKSLQHT